MSSPTGSESRIALARSRHRLEQEKVRWRHRGGHRLALRIVLGRVHRDEHLEFEITLVAMHVVDRDPAQLGFGRERLVVGVDCHDVVELGHRPVWTDAAFSAVVDRILAPQAFEKEPDGILLEQAWVRDIDLRQGNARHRLWAVQFRLERLSCHCSHDHLTARISASASGCAVYQSGTATSIKMIRFQEVFGRCP